MARPGRPSTAHLDAAVTHLRAGRPGEARRILEAVLRANPRDADAHHLLGLALIDDRKTEKGLQHLRRAVEIRPGYAEAINNLAIELSRLGRHAEAAASFDQALALDPRSPRLLHNKALCLSHLGRAEDALRGLDAALALAPEDPDILRDRAGVLLDLDRADEAQASADHALAARPNDPFALRSRASALLIRNQPEAARVALEQSLRAAPDDPDTLTVLAAACVRLHELDRALEAASRALALRPNNADAHLNRAAALRLHHRGAEALASLDRALQLRPNDPDILLARASTLATLQRDEEVVPVLDRVLQLAPHRIAALGMRFRARLFCCDWTGYDATAARIADEIAAGRPADTPFSLLAHATSPALLRAAASQASTGVVPASVSPLPKGSSGGRIRLAYVSGDFREHVMGYLLAPLLAAHDRARFEVIGVSLLPAEDSEAGRACRAACDRFIDASRMSDAAIAGMLRGMAADIAIDLMGHTAEGRPGIFARRVAPVQVNFLGFPGTMGADFMDVILADDHIIPPDHEAWYAERVVRLPDTLFPTEPAPPVADAVPSRADLGLPDGGFVFCSFNNAYKIAPAMFDTWMRILRQVPGSVLWLYQSNAAVPRNLRREAAARGIDPDRLVFAANVPPADYLARLARADLFLDTLPYNAGATAGHALWMDLPVLTITGPTFVGRLAGSQLHAIGLPELIASDLAGYEALAVALATEHARLAGIRERLRANRATHALFDHARYCRNLEAAYTGMLRPSQD